MGKRCYLRRGEVGARIPGVRRKIEYVAVFILFCLWFDWRILRNLGVATFAILYFPVDLVLHPTWNYLTAAFAMNLALAALWFLVVACAQLFAWAKRKLLRSSH